MGLRHNEARRPEVERNDTALLDAARAVVIENGVHTTVAAIAARAGLGIGSLYRRYATKEKLFAHLCVISLRDYLAAAEGGLAHSDPWDGFADYVRSAVLAGTGSLAPIAGTIQISDEMAALSARGDAAADTLIERVQTAGALRADVNGVDIALLIEQLGRSPVVEQFATRDRADLSEAAEHARERLIQIALDGLRASHMAPLPAPTPDWDLFARRWAGEDDR